MLGDTLSKMDSTMLGLANTIQGTSVEFRNDSQFVKEKFTQTYKADERSIHFADGKTLGYERKGEKLLLTDSADKTITELAR